jgi:hypothetical protein
MAILLTRWPFNAYRDTIIMAKFTTVVLCLAVVLAAASYTAGELVSISTSACWTRSTVAQLLIVLASVTTLGQQ